MSLPIVAVVGRPNVGKSTLINRVASNRATITHQMPGVTRDRKYVEVEWFDKDFVLIDTGGFEFEKGQSMSSMIAEQAELAIKEADAVIFVVDAKDGLQPYDQELANILRKSAKKIFLAINKVDTDDKKDRVPEFYGLGFKQLFAISASHNRAITELFDAVSLDLPQARKKEDELISVAIVGRPNVGKSSLINKLLGKERVIVSDLPGTTRDAIDTIVNLKDKEWRFIDTAGIKRKKVQDVEYYGLVRTFEVLDRADIALVMVDASEGITEQDQRILDYTVSRGCGIIILLNKWDLVNEDKMKQLERETHRKLQFVRYAPIIDVSVKTGKNLGKVFEQLKAVEEGYTMTVNTTELNNFIRKLDLSGYPSRHKIRINFANQVSEQPAQLIFFIKPIKAATSNLKRFLESQLRREFGFYGSPVKIFFKEKK